MLPPVCLHAAPLAKTCAVACGQGPSPAWSALSKGSLLGAALGIWKGWGLGWREGQAARGFSLGTDPRCPQQVGRPQGAHSRAQERGGGLVGRNSVGELAVWVRA